MQKIANRDAGVFAGNRTPFKGSNLYGEELAGGVFVVYSYGQHFPMFVFKNGKWYANEDRYSVTTSKHYGQAFPRGIDHDKVIKLPTEEMKNLIRGL